jgi:CubicO group peptidase (beta-lactamase class C family)
MLIATLQNAPPVDTALIREAVKEAARLPRLRSLVIQHDGRIVAERYFHGATRERRANIKSASKSIVSALVGIAVARGEIKSLDQTLGELLPAETRSLEPLKRAITVRDLLTMRAGLQSTSFENYGAWVSSRNWVRDALRRPMEAPPGGPMIYSTGNTHLLSAILTRRTRASTYAFAARHLAQPLGIELRPWNTDPQGIYFGGNDMYLTPRQMLAFGTLYLQRGAYRGRRVLPAAWVDSSLVERTVSPWNGNRYGYGWWTREANGVKYHFAWGYGGQFIFIVPSRSLVVVTTSDSESSREGSHTQAIYSILEGRIIAAVQTLSRR